MVCQIVPSKLGAYEKFMVRLAETARYRGYQVDFLVPGDPHATIAARLHQAGSCVTVGRNWLGRGTREKFSGFIIDYMSATLKTDYSLTAFHFCSEVPVSISLTLKRLLRHARRVHVWHQRSEIVNKASLAHRHCSRLRLVSLWMDGIVMIYKGGLPAALARGVPDAKLTYIHNGTDEISTRDQRMETRKMLGIDPHVPVLIVVSSLIPRKDVASIVNALPEVVSQFPLLKCLIVGDGELKPALEELSKEKGLCNCVMWLGRRNDVSALMGASDVFILASKAEPFGFVNIEAMAQRLPVVATNVGGIPEIVVDSVTGMLFNPGDSRELCAAILRLLKDPDVREVMGNAGYERYKECFTLDSMANNYCNYYEKMAHSRITGD
jgi:glycosyltransferase involved in cell wall biosynthesis